jgi:hypothetical protein
MPGAFKSKAFSVIAAVVFGYFLFTDPTGTAHAIKDAVHGIGAFFSALRD